MGAEPLELAVRAGLRVAASVEHLPAELPILVASVFAGALLGTWLGVSRLPRHRLLQGLAIVLVIAALKLLFT